MDTQNQFGLVVGGWLSVLVDAYFINGLWFRFDMRCSTLKLCESFVDLGKMFGFIVYLTQLSAVCAWHGMAFGIGIGGGGGEGRIGVCVCVCVYFDGCEVSRGDEGKRQRKMLVEWLMM